MNEVQNVVGVNIRMNHTLVMYSALRMLYLMCQLLSLLPKEVDMSYFHLLFPFYINGQRV